MKDWKKKQIKERPIICNKWKNPYSYKKYYKERFWNHNIFKIKMFRSFLSGQFFIRTREDRWIN